MAELSDAAFAEILDVVRSWARSTLGIAVSVDGLWSDRVSPVVQYSSGVLVGLEDLTDGFCSPWVGEAWCLHLEGDSGIELLVHRAAISAYQIRPGELEIVMGSVRIQVTQVALPLPMHSAASRLDEITQPLASTEPVLCGARSRRRNR